MDRFQISTSWQTLYILSEPYLVKTRRGYALSVKASYTDDNTQICEFYISGIKSLADGIEPLRSENFGNFQGLCFQVKKQSSERTSPYEVKAIENNTNSNRSDTNIKRKQLTYMDKLWAKINGD